MTNEFSLIFLMPKAQHNAEDMQREDKVEDIAYTVEKSNHFFD